MTADSPTARRFSVTTRAGRTVTVHSDLGDAQAARLCRESGHDFAARLAADVERGRPLHPSGLAWLHVLAVEHRDRLAREARHAAEVAAGNVLVLPRVAELFAHAREHLKRPKIRLARGDGRSIRLALAGARSKYPGHIWVADDRRDGRLYGRIDAEGGYHESRPDGELTELLVTFNDDPAALAGEQGRLSGHCSFCDRPLDDERSTAVGFGPVCARHWGLPWGEAGKQEQKARVRASRRPTERPHPPAPLARDAEAGQRHDVD
jgi:hypothetical protein